MSTHHRRLRRAAKTLSKLGDPLAGKRQPARAARRASPRGDGPTIDQRLAPIAENALAGEHVECAWELFRLQYFPGWPHERVAAALGLWAARSRIKVTFEGRTAHDRPIIWVCFGC